MLSGIRTMYVCICFPKSNSETKEEEMCSISLLEVIIQKTIIKLWSQKSNRLTVFYVLLGVELCKKLAQHGRTIVCFSNLSFSVVVNHIISLNPVFKQVKLIKSALSFHQSKQAKVTVVHEGNTQLWAQTWGHLGSWPWLRPSDPCLGLDRHSWP